MALMKWKPRNENFAPSIYQDLLDWEHPFFGLSLFPSVTRAISGLRDSWYPALDISEDKQNIVIRADIPGMKKEDIHLSVDDSVLTLRGERKREEERKDKNYHTVERSYGVFERRIDLGTRLDQSKIKAGYHDGVLEITLPKAEASLEKKVEIQ